MTSRTETHIDGATPVGTGGPAPRRADGRLPGGAMAGIEGGITERPLVAAAQHTVVPG